MSEFPAELKSVHVKDCGDGSVSVVITFVDGRIWRKNMDIPYETQGIMFTDEGESVMTYDEETYELIPDPDWN